MTLSGRTVLVTGASGTVGSVVARTLGERGARVRAMVRDAGQSVAGEAVRGDLGDLPSLRRAVGGAELVVHCAAALSFDLATCTAVNVDGVRHLVDAMRAEGCPRLVHLSSVSVYDPRRGLDFDEESALWTEPLDAYGFTKAEGERLVRDSGLAFTILRPVIVLSAHPRSFWGPLAIARARSATAPLLPLATLPYVHVDNLAEAVVLAAGRDAAVGRAYDVIDGYGETRDFLAAVYGALGREPPPLPAVAKRFTYAGRRLREELGWAPVDRWRDFLAELSAAGG